MDDVYKKAFAEVLEILKNSDENIVNKIPEKFIEFLKQNMDKDYQVNIDFSNYNWEDNVKEETQAILALIYRDYIVSPEKRKLLLEEEKAEQAKIEQELREKYDTENLFKKNNETIQEETESTQLVQIKEYPWYKKIYYKILKIFGRK